MKTDQSNFSETKKLNLFKKFELLNSKSAKIGIVICNNAKRKEDKQ